MTVITLVAALAVPARVGAATADEARLLALTNATRAAAGVAPLALDGTLSTLSRQWAQVMAVSGAISHNPSARVQIEAAGYNWRALAENVGMGPTVEAVHTALVNSPGHYTNMVNGSYTLVGIGIVSSGGYVWVVQNFVAVAAAAPPPPSPSPPPPSPAPAPTSPPPAPAPAPTAPVVTAAPDPSPAPAPRRTPGTTEPPPPPAPEPEPTTTTTAPAPATTTTTAAALPPPSGLPLALAQMVQQVNALRNPR